MSIDVKLQKVYKNLIDGVYVDKFDAMSLSAVDLDGGEFPAGEPTIVPEFSTDLLSRIGDDKATNNLRLRGLERLGLEIHQVLTSEYISEQMLMARVSNELLACDNEIQSMIVEGYCVVGRERLGFASHPQLATESNHNMQANSKKNDQIYSSYSKEDIIYRLQEAHEYCTAALMTKSFVFDKTEQIYRTYQDMLSELSQSCGVLSADKRSRIVVEPHLKVLMGNKLFEAESVRNQLNTYSSDLHV
jgi:hypothetical protein